MTETLILLLKFVGNRHYYHSFGALLQRRCVADVRLVSEVFVQSRLVRFHFGLFLQGKARGTYFQIYMGTDKTLVDPSVSMEHCLRNNCIRTYSGRLYDCSGQI